MPPGTELGNFEVKFAKTNISALFYSNIDSPCNDNVSATGPSPGGSISPTDGGGYIHYPPTEDFSPLTSAIKRPLSQKH